MTHLVLRYQLVLFWWPTTAPTGSRAVAARSTAALIACDATTAYPGLLLSALDTGLLDPSAAGGVVAQAVPYVGMGRADAFARLTAEVVAERGVELPLPSRATVTAATAAETGLRVQRLIVATETVDAVYPMRPEISSTALSHRRLELSQWRENENGWARAYPANLPACPFGPSQRGRLPRSGTTLTAVPPSAPPDAVAGSIRTQPSPL